jgi:hypothetical protein
MILRVVNADSLGLKMKRKPNWKLIDNAADLNSALAEFAVVDLATTNSAIGIGCPCVPAQPKTICSRDCESLSNENISPMPIALLLVVSATGSEEINANHFVHENCHFIHC